MSWGPKIGKIMRKIGKCEKWERNILRFHFHFWKPDLLTLGSDPFNPVPDFCGALEVFQYCTSVIRRPFSFTKTTRNLKKIRWHNEERNGGCSPLLILLIIWCAYFMNDGVYQVFMIFACQSVEIVRLSVKMGALQKNSRQGFHSFDTTLDANRDPI